MKVAIIGLGFMGGMHAQIYSALSGIDLVAIVDPEVADAERKIADMGLSVQVFPDLPALLAGTEVDIIDICTPTDCHADLAVAAAEAGKHLFIEKPLALSLSECEKIQAAVEQAGVFAQVGQCIRFWPEYIALREFIESGKGGALKSLSLLRRAARPAYSREDWLNDGSRSGGAACDLHVHDTDFVLHLFGQPKSVFSQCTQGRSGCDHIFTHYDYDDVVVIAEGGWDYPEHYGFCMAFEAIFEDASVSWDSTSGTPPVLVLREQEPVHLDVRQPGPKNSTTGEGNISSLGGYFNELEYFTNCLQANQPPAIATLQQASESIRVILAELESAKTGNPLKL